MGTRPTLFLHPGNFSKIPVKIKQQQHASSCEMPSHRRIDVPISNMCCRIAFCKYLDAYVNAMARVSLVQSNRAREFPLRSGGKEEGEVRRPVRVRAGLTGLSCTETNPAHAVTYFGSHVTCSLRRASECPPQQARESPLTRPLRLWEAVLSVSTRDAGVLSQAT